MMRAAAILLVALSLASTAQAGPPRTLCDDACIEARTAFLQPAAVRSRSAAIAPAVPGIVWIEGGDSFAYARETPDDVELYRVDPSARTRSLVVRASTIIAKVGASVKAGDLPAGALRMASDGRSAALALGARSYRYDIATGAVAPVESTPSEALSPDGRYRVYTRDHDLYARSAGGGEVRLSRDAALWYSFAGAVADTQPTNRSLLDGSLDARPPLIGWIGDGPLFYIRRQDLRETGELWQVDAFAGRRPRLITKKMPMPGEKAAPPQELWIFDARGGPGVKIQAGDWPFLGNLDVGGGGFWPSADGTTLYFARFSRGYATAELCAADLHTGAVRVILRETPAGRFSPRFTEFVPLRRGFVWRTDRSGYQHYGLYDWTGRFLRDLTPGPTVVREILHVDERNDELLYTAYDDAALRNPRQVRMRRTSLGTGRSTALDREDAHHEISMAPSGQVYVDSFSRPDLAPTLVARDAAGRVAMTVETSDVTALAASGWQPPERVRVPAADGRTPLYGVLWRPHDLAPGMRLPIVTEVYPGPSGENPPYRFDPAHVDARLAELGLAVLRVGQRGGTFVRGKAYQDYPLTTRSVRDYPIADNKAAIAAVAAAHSFIDSTRVGIIGHSGGGLMAATAILLEPDFYKVAVAASGNHDNMLYELGSSEYHFGDPYAGPAGSAEGYASNAALAGRLKGRLLIVHGALDSDVDLGNSYRLMQALIDAGKDFDTLILPRQRHDYAGADAAYAQRKSWRYLLDGLSTLTTEAARAR